MINSNDGSIIYLKRYSPHIRTAVWITKYNNIIIFRLKRKYSLLKIKCNVTNKTETY
ncbi:hypothetical protein EEGS03_15840 [Escherichia coli]|nr:hypothetical protein EEGS03_15840 [Escherichia coli]BDW52634.1 hypothetical protein JNE120393_00670 [Escherichia coli]BEB29862.1 hypothetical protein VEE44_16660 [Escherichia coli]